MSGKPVLSILVIAAAASLARADKPSGLIAYWDFEEGGGDTVFDQSGTGHHGTPQGNYDWTGDASPYPGSQWAGSFGGVGEGNGYLLVPDADDLDPVGDFTFSAWVKANYREGYKIILGKHAAGQNQDGSWGWGVGRTGDDLVQYFISTPWSYELQGQDVIAEAEWRHLTMTYDDSENTYEYWIHAFDGQTVSLVGYETGQYDANIMNNSKDLNIGGWQQDGDYSGLLDEVCLFDRVLSWAEIQTLVPSACEFYDDFQDDVLDGWTPVGPHQQWGITTSGSERWLEAGPVGDDKLNLLMLDDYTCEGVSIQFKFRLEQHHQNSSGAGVVFRNQEELIPPAQYPGEHYSVMFGHGLGSGWLRITRGSGFSSTGDDFADWSELFTDIGVLAYPAWNEAVVMMPAGSSAFNVWLNGEKIVDNVAADGEVLGAGQMGLINHYANTHFDDVHITPMFLTGSDPAHGWIDARQPLDPNTLEPQGLTSLQLTLSFNAEGLTPAHFSITEVCSAGECDEIAPTLMNVVASGTTATLTLDRPIDPKAWTVITHVGSGTNVWLGFLPADADGSRFANANDIVTIVDNVNEAFGGGSPAVQSSDIDRSGIVTANDIVVLIDLLNGASPFDAYFGESLP